MQDKMIPLYVNQVMQGQSRRARRQILEKVVPFNVRDRVKAEVEYRWAENRKRANTRNR
jgi:hypothetical protein